jgi:capsule polysaccharide export protein KpsC/LpsZ
MNIVIKRHPRCHNKEVAELLNELKKFSNIFIYEGSIHSVIKKCLAVYTINSGVGFESLFHLKPVVTFGEVDYQSATFNVKSFDDLEKNLIPVLTDEKIEYIKKFISYFMTQKNIDISNKQNITNFVDSFVMNYLDNRLKEIYE